MAGAEARLDSAGVSLWLTDWKVDGGGAWSGRRVLALVGGAHAGHLSFYVHPDEQAVEVVMMEVSPDYQRRNLGSVMMDALYAAYPTAWINHGGRTTEGSLWWDRYSEPAPERNVHNRPPSEWATHFEPLLVAAQKTQNVFLNRLCGVNGHREAVYRYDESMAGEAQEHAPAFQDPAIQGPDPGRDELYGGVRLSLPPGLHRIVYDSDIDPVYRAGLLLGHFGHGNLPSDGAWNTTEHGAFEDLVHEQVFDTAFLQPTTHLTFHTLPLAGQERPAHEVKATWVRFANSPGLDVELAGMSWRSRERPWVTHNAVFDPPIDAAIAPAYMWNASSAYRARYNAIGDLLPGQAAQRPEGTSPYAAREAEIRAKADKIQQGIARREAGRLTASTSGQQAPADHQQERMYQQPPPQQAPRLR